MVNDPNAPNLNAAGINIVQLVADIYDKLYGARSVLVELAITPRGHAAIGTLDDVLRTLHNAHSALQLFVPMMDTNPELAQLVERFTAGDSVSEADFERAFEALGPDAKHILEQLRNRETTE